MKLTSILCAALMLLPLATLGAEPEIDVSESDSPTTTSEIEAPKAVPKVEPKKTANEKKTSTKPKRILSNTTEFGLGSQSLQKSPGSLSLNYDSSIALSLGFARNIQFLLGLFEIEALKSTGRFGYSSTSGKANYLYRGDSGTTYTTPNADFKMSTLLFQFGFRIDPLATFSFRPYAEYGFGLAYNSMEFSDSIRAGLSSQGSDFRLKNEFGSAGTYWLLGANWIFAETWGAFAQVKFDQTAGFSTSFFNSVFQADTRTVTLGLSLAY